MSPFHRLHSGHALSLSGPFLVTNSVFKFNPFLHAYRSAVMLTNRTSMLTLIMMRKFGTPGGNGP